LESVRCLAFVWLADIAALSHAEAAEAIQDNALRFLRATLADCNAQ
jgi:hypothetical protein